MDQSDDPPAVQRRNPTMREVAKLAGVDPSVVSRLLNEDPRLSISAATRERVLAAVKELDYRPNPAARALRTARSRLVAVLLPDLANPVYAQLMHGIQTRASDAGYGLVIAESHQVLDREHDASDLIHRVDGLLVAAGTFSKPQIDQLRSLPIPTVAMNRHTKGVSGSVVINDREGSLMVADHLLALGHRRFVVLLGSEKDGVGAARLKAFKAHVEKNGGCVSALTGGGFSARGGYEAASKFFAEASQATAMFAVNFMLGIGALRAAHEHGIRPPDDFSIAALHESELAAYTTPSLTTVQMPMKEVGAAAFDQLLEVLNNSSSGRKRSIRTAPILFARESTGPAPEAGEPGSQRG